jgi:hypothetical protein
MAAAPKATANIDIFIPKLLFNQGKITLTLDAASAPDQLSSSDTGAKS